MFSFFPTPLIGSKYAALLILAILHLPATPFVPRQSCTSTLCSPLFLGMHVTSGEVVTSVECGHRIGRYLTDVIETDYMRLYPLPLTSHAGCNRHREMVHDSSKPQFSKAVRTERSPYVTPSSTWRTFLLFPRSLLLYLHPPLFVQLFLHLFILVVYLFLLS